LNGYASFLVASLPTQLEASSENDLVKRLAAGDRDAFVATYRAHFAEVRAFAERLLGCRVSAEDLVHDVFLNLPAAFARFRGDTSIRSYILSIAVNSARDHVRRAQRRRSLATRLADEPSVGWVPGPDVSVEQQELGRRLVEALDSLPLDQRVAFVLCEIEERTSFEAAEILGEKDGTVRARVFHAKKKLRERLAELHRAACRDSAPGDER
jgi:RNA polymerase sigma-70 factor (ECF subfamily)